MAVSLKQEHDGTLMPVSFAGRVLKDGEVRYALAEKEIPALLCMTQTCRLIVVECPPRVTTHHSAMSWLFNVNRAPGRVLQWAAMLPPLPLTIERESKSKNESSSCWQHASSRHAVDEALEGIRSK
ncbi:uncharacterized protein CCR75_000111 [Bremia lactucae]|uniref:Reverse transcriptase RNase H-like domain-containing protein n=1 Tax=Bremia lactucae TaxID=4779 RepID=A0A976IIL9_BRELC|nr:hypothetical protein CCR75_000111 [Bremia lactucae]